MWEMSNNEVPQNIRHKQRLPDIDHHLLFLFLCLNYHVGQKEKHFFKNIYVGAINLQYINI